MPMMEESMAESATMRVCLQQIRSGVRGVQARLESWLHDQENCCFPSLDPVLDTALRAVASQMTGESLERAKAIRWFYNQVSTIVLEELVSRTLLPIRGSTHVPANKDIEERAKALESLLVQYPSVAVVVSQYALHLSEQREAQQCKVYIQSHSKFLQEVASIRKEALRCSTSEVKERLVEELNKSGGQYVQSLVKSMPESSPFVTQAQKEVAAAVEEVCDMFSVNKLPDEDLAAVETTLQTRSKRQRTWAVSATTPAKDTSTAAITDASTDTKVKSTSEPGKEHTTSVLSATRVTPATKPQRRKGSNSLKAVKERLKQDLEAKAQERINQLRGR